MVARRHRDICIILLKCNLDSLTFHACFSYNSPSYLHRRSNIFTVSYKYTISINSPINSLMSPYGRYWVKTINLEIKK